jgi:glycosyltransferase involved in cell wall biosynthesis
MEERLAELLAALDSHADPAIRLRVTATEAEVRPAVARHPRVQLVGHLDHRELRQLQARSRALYFPSGLESFGYPLAEARVSGQPVIARDTAQNAEIAGPALCGFTPDDAGSLRRALGRALTLEVAPDPAPFDPDTYFGWLLGPAR